jgi:diguanylate cyclase (GGDEF)-like protein/PAS domain S-box-containing protein
LATREEFDTIWPDLAATIPGALFRIITAPNGGWRVLYFSPGIEALLGLTPDQAGRDRRRLRQCVLSQDQPGHSDSVKAAIAKCSEWEHEYRICTPAGVTKWLHGKATPKLQADGRLIWSGMLTDITARKRAEADLLASEEGLRSLIENVQQGVIHHDQQGRIASANPAALAILGLRLDQLLDLSSPDPRWQALREDGSLLPAEQQPALQALKTGQAVRNVIMGLILLDRETVWLQVNAIPSFKNGQLTGVYAHFEDITERIRLASELRLQASTDFLTGAANRRGFMHSLSREFERIQRHPGLQSCVLMLDLDHFKKVNDSFGHSAGDAVLKQVTCLMKLETRRLDALGRIGGEEFALLLPDTARDEALLLANRLRERIERSPLQFQQQSIPTTVSIGCSLIELLDSNADAVMVRADKALYQAKRQGRNQTILG